MLVVVVVVLAVVVVVLVVIVVAALISAQEMRQQVRSSRVHTKPDCTCFCILTSPRNSVALSIPLLILSHSNSYIFIFVAKTSYKQNADKGHRTEQKTDKLHDKFK